MSTIHPALRAELDRELSNAVDGLLLKAAEHDGKDLIEANVDLTNDLLANLSPSQLATAAASLAFVRTGGSPPIPVQVPTVATMRKPLRYALAAAVWLPVHLADRLRGVNPPASLRRGMQWARGDRTEPTIRTAEEPATIRSPGRPSSPWDVSLPDPCGSCGDPRAWHNGPCSGDFMHCRCPQWVPAHVGVRPNQDGGA